MDGQLSIPIDGFRASDKNPVNPDTVPMPQASSGENTRLCRRCNKVLSIKKFGRRKNSVDGYNRTCKRCFTTIRRKAHSKSLKNKEVKTPAASEIDAKQTVHLRNITDELLLNELKNRGYTPVTKNVTTVHLRNIADELLKELNELKDRGYTSVTKIVTFEL